ncbi:MAG: nucleoid-associated protein [Candidatus Thiodiazotropha sp. (ex Cardiolucina cf. quadrata)]|nr:nucleoid-associated protein [Candidatus Thiodiazotropha sp. (ex Cardiolucina cf. quadrata)]
MILSDDLATLKIRKIIFHDVPINSKGSTNSPTLAEAVTDIDVSHSDMLKNRLIRALGSKSAYEIKFVTETSSPVPAEVKEFTAKQHQINYFIEMSRRLAQHLFEQQGGQMSPGLLCVIEVVSRGRKGLAILKLERERGADLQLSKVNGKRRFDMSVLDSLVFTDGTRLFKSALFIRMGNDEFLAAACDSQRSVMSSKDVARFWLRFMGCQVTEEPRVATQKWFDATIRFVNEYVTDPVVKNDVYEHILSELKSNKKNIVPKTFIIDYIPDDYRNEYQDFIKNNGVPMHSFEKDTSDIKSKLRTKSLHTAKGVTVTLPVEEEQLVEIETEQIVIHDLLQNIANK